MKRFIYTIFIVLGLLYLPYCQENLTDDYYDASFRGPKFRAGFVKSDVRTYINDEIELRWHSEDQISLFVGSTLNKRYKFDGETGDNAGYFSDISTPTFGTGNKVNRHYAVYPYNSTIRLSEDGVLTTIFPARQSYSKGSFGKGANMMVAVTADTDDYDLIFSNVGSYLRVCLWGEEQTVKTITVTSNGDEAIVGNAKVTPAYNSAPTCEMIGGANSVTLDCEEAVELSSSINTPTEFWIVLPPVTLSKGFSVKVTNKDNETQVFEVNKSFTFARNTYYTLTRELTLEDASSTQTPPNNEIWYTTSDGKVLNPYINDIPELTSETKDFGVNVISNTYVDGKGVITFDGDLTIVADFAFSSSFAEGKRLTSISLPNSIITIGANSFSGCINLTDISLSKRLDKISLYAFNNCTGLPSITIPNSVTTISHLAFCRCHNLKEFKGKYAFDGGRCLVQNGVIIAYASNSGTEYSIPDSIKAIGRDAFSYCNGLISVIIPENISRIGNGAFSFCDNLKNVSISNGVTAIEDDAFAYCKALESITIPITVASVGSEAFNYCRQLKSVYCKPLVAPKINSTEEYWRAFDNCHKDLVIYHPSSSRLKYSSGWGKYRCQEYDFNDKIDDPNIPNEIWYTSTDGKIVQPYRTDAFGANIISNTYSDGKGVIKFDNDVYQIFNYTFYKCSNLKSIILPNSVESICEYAFRSASNLTSVTLPGSVAIIDNRAFYECANLEEVNLSEGVYQIGEFSFYKCTKLKRINLPNSLKHIGAYSFYNCSSLEDMTLPESLLCIEQDAFNGCSSLKEVAIPNSLTSIGTSIFSNCTNLSKATIGTGIKSIGYKMFLNCKSLTSVSMSDNISIIDGSAFEGCEILSSIDIPNSVTSIGDAAFAGCSSLTTIKMPDNLQSFGKRVFNNCTELSSFTGKNITEDGRCLILSNRLMAFAPAGITIYRIPEVTTINDYAFAYCNELTNVIIPSSVTSIGHSVFSECPELTNVDIGANVVSIGSAVFFNCSNLKSVSCRAAVPPLMGDNVFYNNAADRIIYVPLQSVDKYKADTKWSVYADAIEGKEFSDEEGGQPILPTPTNDMIWYTSSDGKVVTPDMSNFKVSILSNTYYSERNMGVIQFNSTVSSIGHDAFKNATTLTSISLPESITNIGNYAFANTSITDFTVPPKCWGIGDYAFDGCSNLANVDLANVTIIGNYAFKDCSLTKVTIPSTAESFGHGPFKCATLQEFQGPNVKGDGRSLHIGSALIQLADGACKNITSYTVPNDVRVIHEGVFKNYKNLKSVTISEGVTTIYADAFNGCDGLKKVILPSTLSVLYNRVFKNCSSLKSIYFNSEKSPTEIYGADESWDLCNRDVVIRVSKGSLTSYTYEGAWQAYNVVEFEPGDYSHDDEPSGGGDNTGGDNTGGGNTGGGYLEGFNDGDVITVQKASQGNGIDIVLVGDAYSQATISSGVYHRDLEKAVNTLFVEEPYKSFRHLFNIHIVTAVSADDGYDHGPSVFEGYFGVGTEVGGNHDTVLAYALQVVPIEKIEEALIIVLMNKRCYAGTCYMGTSSYKSDYGSGIAVSYLPLGTSDEMLGELVRHEAGGHGFAKLADEYAYQSMGTIPYDIKDEALQIRSQSGWFKNVDFTSNPNTVLWKHFLSDTRYYFDGLGVYQGGLTYWSGVWRPTSNSIMNDNTGGFNAPSREAIYYRIYKLAYGTNWSYDYESFVSWDAKNRAISYSAPTKSTLRTFTPTHPPVIIKTSLLRAK